MPNFTTSYGRDIPLIPGYRKHHRIESGSKIFYQEAAPARVEFYGFMKDLYEYFMMLDFLRDAGVDGHWGSALDIGGEEGIVSYFLKADGRTEKAVNIDMRDLRHCLDRDLFNSHMSRFLSWREQTTSSRAGTSIARTEIDSFFADFNNEFAYHPKNGSSLLQCKFNHPAGLDQFIHGDIYEQTEKYDLITALLCLDWFDLDKLFSKVHDLLNDGGTFFFVTNYWWWPVNSTTIAGDFPYLCQRLDRRDLARYFEAYYPQEREDTLIRYDYFNKGKHHPTMNDYAMVARRAGLDLLSQKRIMPHGRSHPRTPFTPHVIDMFPDTKLDGVLADIHCFRNDVQLADLQTAFAMFAFTKRPKSPHSLANVLEFSQANQG